MVVIKLNLNRFKYYYTSIWKRYQFCGGASVFGTECYIDELTDVAHCTCKKEDNLKGFDWTIIFIRALVLVPKAASSRNLILQTLFGVIRTLVLLPTVRQGSYHYC